MSVSGRNRTTVHHKFDTCSLWWLGRASIPRDRWPARFFNPLLWEISNRLECRWKNLFKPCSSWLFSNYFSPLRGNSSSSVFQSRVLIFTCWSFSYIHTSRYRFFRWIPFARGYLVLVIKFSFDWKYATWEERDVSSDVRKETVRYILYESSLKLYDWLILRSFNSKSEDLVSNRMNVLFRVIFLHIFLRRIVSWWRTSQVTSQVISLHGWRKDIALTICRSTD